MTKKVNRKTFLSMNTRCENKYKELKEQIKLLYKERFDLIKEISYYNNIEDHSKAIKIKPQQLFILRFELLKKLVDINVKTKSITDEMITNHKKKIDYLKRYKDNV